MYKLDSKILMIKRMTPVTVESLARNTKIKVEIRAIWEIIKSQNSLDDISFLFKQTKNDSYWIGMSNISDLIVANSHTPVDVLQSMFDKFRRIEGYRLGNIAAHDNATIEMLETALSHKAVTVREYAARSKKLTHAHRKVLVNDKSIRVRQAIAECAGAEEDILLALMNDKSTCVKMQVLRHPRATEEMIVIGMQDKSASVRNLAMIHSLAPLDELIKHKVERVVESIVKGRDGDSVFELVVRAKLKEMFKNK
jgi:hypothetical protein